MEPQVFRVSPSLPHHNSHLPVTLYDIFWVRFHPVERIFFFRLPDPSPATFHNSVIPNLKRSLSLALDFFYPLAGRLSWPSDATKPVFLYDQTDSVSFKVSESQNPDSFSLLAGRKPFKASETRQYVPELSSTESEAELVAFQVTLFRGHGLAIGMASHHAFVDGKSSVMFLKAWSHFNKMLSMDSCLNGALPLPQELNPLIIRPTVEDPEELYSKFLTGLPRRVKVGPSPDLDPSLVRGTFELSDEDVKKMREFVMSKAEAFEAKSLHLSTFVLAYSFIIRCLCKVNKMEGTVSVLISADKRGSHNYSNPDNVFCNCLAFTKKHLKVEDVVSSDGLAAVAIFTGELVKELRKTTICDSMKIIMENGEKMGKVTIISLAGSPRFGVYKTDFGWGSPEKVEITSIDRKFSVSLADRREGSGGVELGFVLDKKDMVELCKLFEEDLLTEESKR